MAVRKIFQTLKYRNNNDEVLAHGPYPCSREDAWLSYGFYFWEHSIKPAHYWGKRWCQSKYIICQAFCDLTENNCFDLVGNVNHNELFTQTVEYLIQIEFITPETTVQHVIDFLRSPASDSFKYSAARIESSEAFDMDSYSESTVPLPTTMIFDLQRNRVKLKLNMVVQLCIFDLEGVNFKGFEIIYQQN